MKKRGLVILGVIVLLGIWLMIVGYEFLEKENARFQKNVKAAKEEQQRCAARNSKYRNYDQFRTSIRLPYVSDLPVERWMHQYDTLRAGMSESEVEIILGAPDYARCGLSMKGDQFLGSSWNYEIAIPTELAANGQNSEIEVFFGPDGKVTDKNARNMQPKPSLTPTPMAAVTPPPAEVPSPSETPSPSATPNANATSQPTPSATPVTATPATATPSPTPQ